MTEQTPYGKTISVDGLVVGESVDISLGTYSSGVSLNGGAMNGFSLTSANRSATFTAVFAGSYTVAIDTVTAGLNTLLTDYTLTAATSTSWVIHEKVLTATWSVTSASDALTITNAVATHTYDAKVWTPSVLITGVCANDVVSVSASYEGTIKYAGSYEITGALSGTDYRNYVLDVPGITVTINQLMLAFHWAAEGSGWTETNGVYVRDYDAETHRVYVVFDNVQTGDSIEGVYTDNIKKNANVGNGTYTAVLTGITGGDCAGSYTLTGVAAADLSKSFKINKVDFNNGGEGDLSLVIPSSLVYNAENKTVTMNHNTTRLGDTYDYTISYSTDGSNWTAHTANTDYVVKNVGTYYVRVAISNENYNTPSDLDPNNAGLIAQSFTITAAALTGFTMEDVETVYSKENKTVSVTNANGRTAGDLEKAQYYGINGDTATVTITYVYYTDALRTAQTTTANDGAVSAGDAPMNEGVYYVRATIVPSTANYANSTICAISPIKKTQ